jgi:uncharacterized membrane protein
MRVDEIHDNEQRTSSYRWSAGWRHLMVGIVLFVLGGLLFAHAPLNDSEDLSRAGGLALLGVGAFAIIAGAVTRGVQLAHQR